MTKVDKMGEKIYTIRLKFPSYWICQDIFERIDRLDSWEEREKEFWTIVGQLVRTFYTEDRIYKIITIGATNGGETYIIDVKYE